MPKGIRHATGVTIAALLILLSPVSAVAQRHQGLVSISVESTLSVSAFRELDALVDRMIRENELVLRSASDDRSVPDRHHERFSQYFRGVPVYGGGVSRQTAGGMTVSVFGAVYQQIELDLAATLSVDAAAAVLENLSGTTLVRDGRPSLIILPRLEGDYALTYRATMRNARTYFVDAHTGQVLVEVDERLSESAVGAGQGVLGDAKKVSANRVAGSFRTQDQLRPAEILTLDTRGSEATLDRLIDGTTFDSDIATDADNTWTDTAVVDAHVHTGWTYDYFSQRHGWAGLDGEDSRVFSSVNDFSILPNNAFFVPAPFGPEGRGGLFFGETSQGTPLTVLDVAAHEFMHGVTAFSAGLQPIMFTDGLGPENILLASGAEACDSVTLTLDGTAFPFWCFDGRFVLASNHGGAINEAFSDVFGTGAEFFFHEPGDGPLTADYESGEDLPVLGPIRALDAPQSLAISGPLVYPDHLSQRVRFAVVILEGTPASPTLLAVVPVVFLDDQGTFLQLGSTDNGAVHMNATILGHAFYLAIEGGQNPTSGLSVPGVGSTNRDQIERVFFRAMTELMPSVASFDIAAAAIFQSATDLFGAGSSVWFAVGQALVAVGF